MNNTEHQTRYQTLMDEGEKRAKFIRTSNPPLAPGYQHQLLGLCVIAQELRVLTSAVRSLIDTIRNLGEQEENHG